MKDSLLRSTHDTLHVMMHQAPDAAKSGPGYWIWILAILIILALVFVFRKKLQGIRPKEYELDISIFKIKGDIQYTTIGQEVAWKIYVELETRITANELDNNDGILREALQSLYVAFGSLREALKSAGSELAKESTDPKKLTVASLLLKIMNEQMRPFLSKWHPLLQEYEIKKPINMSQYEHEKQWDRNETFRKELHTLKAGLSQYIIAQRNIAAGATK